MSKKKKFVVLALIVFSLEFLLAGEVVEEIVAIVNNDIITLSQYRQQYEALVQMLRAQYQGEEYEEKYKKMKSEILDSMITELLLIQLAKEKNLNVSSQVKLTLENIKKENNLDSDEDLRRALRSQGMDYDQFLKQMEETLLRQAVIFSEVEQAIVVDDSETVGYFKQHQKEFVEPEEYKLRAISIESENKSNEEIEAKKKEISDKIQAGEDFVALAGLYAEGPLKDSQGDLGSIKKGELEKSLEQAVGQLKKGEMTPWIKVKNGWILLRLEEKKDSRLLSFEEAKKDIEEKVFSQKRNAKLEEFLKKIRQESYVKILNPNPLNL